MATQSGSQTGGMPPNGGADVPKRFPLVVNPSNRDESPDKDARLINCYGEHAEDGAWWLYKRPGLTFSSQPSGGAAAGAGLYNWLGDIYAIIADRIYKNGVVLAGTIDSTGGVYRFTQCLGSTPKLIFGNGVEGYTYDSGAGVVNITDADFPNPFKKGWAYLDGTVYVIQATAHILGSAINNPQSWDPLNDILAQIEPDLGVALAKQLVYVVAFKQWTTEVFYDAGNPTASPLGRVEGAKVNWGCASQDSVQDVDGVLLWIGQNRSSSNQVIMMENLKAEAISTKPIERLLDNADFSTVYSWQLKLEGHKFYVFTVVSLNMTLAFDITERLWHQWTDKDGNYFPIVSSCGGANGVHYLQHATNGKIYICDGSYTTDDGDTITVDIYTPNFDAGTKYKKQLTHLEVVADIVPGSELQIRNNDFDYDPTRWSHFRKVDLGTLRPMLTNEGTFRRRAYNIRHQRPTRMRLQALEIDLDLGTM